MDSINPNTFINITSPQTAVLVTHGNDSDSCINDEPEGLQFYRFVTNGLMLNIIGAMGILGNIISMVILSRPQMRSSINYLLIGLARVDTLLIVTSILLFGLPGIYPYSGLLFTYYYVIYPHIAPVIYPLATVAQTASVYLTLTVSLERFVAVCHPLRARSLCTYGRAKIYVFVILVLAVLYNLPKVWEAHIKAEWYPKTNVTIYCPRPSAFRENKLYKTIYIHWMYLIFLYLVPFCGLAILNAAIYKQVRRANRERQRLSRHQKREIGLATMLLCVVAVFFICNLLPLVVNILDTFGLAMALNLSRMISTSNLLVTINSSVNFIIYVIFGEKFQRTFLVLFCHRSLFTSGRDSPEAATREDSLMSFSDRHSVRLQRYNTNRSRNGQGPPGALQTLEKSKQNTTKTKQNNSGTCLYYPVVRENTLDDKQDNNGHQAQFN